MKNKCLYNTDKHGESNGKSGESYVYLFKILNAGGRWKMPLFKKENIEKTK